MLLISFSESNDNKVSTTMSLSNQCGNLQNSNNSSLPHHENASLPPTTASVSFVTDDHNVLPSEKVYSVEVNSRGKTWMVKRNVENFRLLDQQCHQCVYDRKYSQLNEIPMEENLDPSQSSNQNFITSYGVRNENM